MPTEVYNALMSANIVKRDMSALSRNYLALIDHIKVNVTVKNPATHLYNIGSNMLLSFLHGDTRALYQVMKIRMTNREAWSNLMGRANKQGFNSQLDYLEGGLKQFESEKKEPIILRILKETYFAKGSKTGNFLRNAYDWGDKIFKLAHFYRLTREGVDDVAAMRLAQKSYVDYSTPMPAGIRALDKSGLVPFLHYQYKATLMVLKTILKHPVRFAILQGAMAGLGASAWLGGNNEKENYQKPEWAKSKILDNVLGIKSWSPVGNTGWFWNSGRLIPGIRFGDMDFSNWSGGFLGGFLSIAKGQNPLSGHPIAKEDDTAIQHIGKRLIEAAQAYLPALTYGRYGQRLFSKSTKLNPRNDEFGDEMDYSQIFLQGLGVRHFNTQKEKDKKINKLKNETQKELKKAGNNTILKNKIKQEYKFKIEKIKKS
ncbi:MAG: hypothetical protein LBI78_02370 [Campylobacteraceae bacterium]|nr:hypothetical protein [Campylobacteraceae bacterium]